MREHFPTRFCLYDGTGVEPRRELQRREDCLTFGGTSALEAVAARAGEPQQFSTRFLYWAKDANDQSVEGYVRLINRVGLCPDALCPYDLALLDDAPPPAAWLALIPVKLSTARIASREDVMRALCSGHSIITIRTVGGGAEHCECCIGYDMWHGLQIHGSGNDVSWWPWESLASDFTQLHVLTCDRWPAVPCPDYVPGDVPTFEAGELRIPRVRFMHPFSLEQRPPEVYVDVVMHFGPDGLGDVQWQQDVVSGHDPVWQVSRARLMLPVVDVIRDGEVQRLERVTLTQPDIRVMSYAQELEATP